MAFDIVSGKENQERSRTSSCCFFPFMVTDDLKSWSHSGSIHQALFIHLPPSPPHHAFANGGKGVPIFILSGAVTSYQSHYYFFMLLRPRFLYTSQGMHFACLLACFLAPPSRRSKIKVPCRAQEPVFGCFLRKGRRKICDSQSDHLLRA